MVNKDIITRRLSNLEEYYHDLSDIQEEVTSEQLFNDKIMRRYIERTLQMAIESCLDIAGHIISYSGFREPINNQDTFQVLIEEEIIDNKLGERLKKMAQFRNIIVHDYATIDPEIVYTIVKNNITDIRSFSINIKSAHITATLLPLIFSKIRLSFSHLSASIKFLNLIKYFLAFLYFST